MIAVHTAAVQAHHDLCMFRCQQVPAELLLLHVSSWLPLPLLHASHQIVFEEFGFASFLEAPASYFSLQYACTLPALQPDLQPPGEQGPLSFSDRQQQTVKVQAAALWAACEACDARRQPCSQSSGLCTPPPPSFNY